MKDLLQRVVVRLRSLLGLRALEQDLAEELRFHIEMQVEEHMRAGLTARDARRRALVEFGGLDRMAEACRDERPGSRVHLVVRSVRLAARRLVREPSFAVPAVATLAIGFGALLAIFTLADAVLLRPLGYPDADRIVVLRHALPGWGIADAGQSDGTYVHYREGTRVFESMGAYFDRELSITDGEAPERVLSALVTPSVLDVLGVRPFIGRTFNADDDNARGVMLSHGLWQRRYGGDTAIVGGQIEVNGTLRDVVGVLPPGTDFPSAQTELLFGNDVEADRADLREMYREGIARLRPGVSLEEAEADLVRLAGTLGERFPDATAEQLAEAQLTPRVERLQDSVTGDVRPALVLLMCTAVFVLLIALANVANLALVRAEHQRREVAIERALGAGAGAVTLRFAAEYALVALTGAGLGLAGAALAVRVQFGFEPWQIPRLHEAAVTVRTIGLALGGAALTAAVLTAIALLRGRRADVQAALKGSLQRMTPSRESRVVQQGLTSLQVALACALLVGSTVMVQSVIRLGRVELGFRPADVLAFDIALPARQYLPYTPSAGFHDRLREELLRIPGVQDADVVSTLPLTPLASWFDLPITAMGAARGRTLPVAGARLVTPGYFSTMHIPLLHGRTFEAGDLTDASAGVILSATLARSLFGDVNPVGRQIELPETRGTGELTVVGVAGDVRDASLTAPAAPLLYLPSLGAAPLSDGHAPIPFYPTEMTFVVRSALPPEALLPAVRQAVRSLDARLPVAYPRTLDDVVAASSARTRLTAWLLLAAAMSALLLGIVGIYGVVAYAVSRRTPELALRMALGAAPRQVTRMVLRQGIAVALVGVTVGVFVALILTRMLTSMLFEVSPYDLRAFILVPVGMVAIALVASAAPARRAARTSPARVLAGD